MINATARTSTTRRGPAEQAPVIVLTMARSGSTLLRFILDSHPELTCPPEACLGSVCASLARLWDVLEPSPQSAQDGNGAGEVTDLSRAAATAIRQVIDDVYGRYAARHGKRRWCDKSLDSIQIAELLADLYPEAQFVCLYRHCLDVIVSAVEACPWGLAGYGLEQYAAASPGNSIAAVARCWLDWAAPIIEFQRQHPDRCHGIRYEDLITDPEQIAASLFDFLGVERIPGISTACFTTDHDIRGPGDHKIWFTSSINRDSLGQGNRVPAGAFPPELLAKVNQVLAQLEYRQVDSHWPASGGPPDPRADHKPGTGEQRPTIRPDAETGTAASALATWLKAATAEAEESGLAAWWPDAASRHLTFLVRPARSDGPALGWTLSRDDRGLAISESTVPDPASAVLTATSTTWLAILNGQANLAAEQRAGRLHFTSTATAATPAMPAEFRLVARLLRTAANRTQGIAVPEQTTQATPVTTAP